MFAAVKPFKSPERPKLLDGLEAWLREGFLRHCGNADVVRQDLMAEKGVAVSRRTRGPTYLSVSTRFSCEPLLIASSSSTGTMRAHFPTPVVDLDQCETAVNGLIN
jgi:hypothetical protein